MVQQQMQLLCVSVAQHLRYLTLGIAFESDASFDTASSSSPSWHCTHWSKTVMWIVWPGNQFACAQDTSLLTDTYGETMCFCLLGDLRSASTLVRARQRMYLHSCPAMEMVDL